MKKLCNYLAPFQDTDLSSLIGLTSEEYSMLVHGPLYQYQNEDNEIEEFFMYVNPMNRTHLLEKINEKNGNIISFKPEEVFGLRSKQLTTNRQDIGHNVAVTNGYR